MGDTRLPCVKFKGTSVATIKRTNLGGERKVSGIMEKKPKAAQLTYQERDDSPIAITPVSLPRVMDRGRGDEEPIWRQHRLHPEERPRQIKMNAAIICTIARHLRAREWARAMGRRRGQPNNGYDLEKAAERWQGRKELEQRSFIETNQRSASR